jgi:3-deoxy-manno-octulosonate cytidylyltransferase (CMP-KDO synthetase)
MQIAGIIPARYASTRFPGKPLVQINGLSMIRRVYEQAAKAESLAAVIVATDDTRIYDHVRDFGGNVMMTSAHHSSGTDRCGEVVNLLKQQLSAVPYDVVVNIQGDEPFIKPSQINDLAACFTDPQVDIATMATKITDKKLIFDSNAVKLVVGVDARALYFSRNPIPFLRNYPQDEWIQQHDFLKHLGIYAYRTNVLDEIIHLPVSVLEKAESLEQLRWIEHGYKIKVVLTEFENIAIDTPNDLAKLEINLLRESKP